MTDIATAFDDVAQSIANLTTRIRALEALPIAAASYSNVLTNGGFEDWPSGLGPFTSDGIELADNWYIALGAGSTISVAEDGINQDTHQSAECASVAYTHAVESALRQTVLGPFANNTVSLSVRVRTSTPGAVRLLIDGQYSNYHSGSGLYETLILVATPASNVSFDAKIVFDASCAAYIDNAMLIQGAAPIDYVAQMIGPRRWAAVFGTTVPAGSDTLGPSASIAWHWQFFYGTDGFHVDALDDTKIVFEHAGRYMLVVNFGVGVVAPFTTESDGSEYVPLDIQTISGGFGFFHISVPGKGGGYGSHSTYFNMTATNQNPYGDVLQITAVNFSSVNTLLWIPNIYITLDYLGPLD